uniref:Expansin-like EG45 domain-containing protein n=1 Tax=Aegilops tauschii subsp. strangulata TaxID=200361 RepID=A0A453JVN4_AEGTS
MAASFSFARARVVALFFLVAAHPHGCCGCGYLPDLFCYPPPPPAPTTNVPTTNVPATNVPASNIPASNSSSDEGWLDARATWYGAPNGAGPYDNGGACGFKNVNWPPFSSMTSCGNQPIFKDGKGCGSCYQVSITDVCRRRCSGLILTFHSNMRTLSFSSSTISFPRQPVIDVILFHGSWIVACNANAMQIRCVAHRACSGIPETVIITDMNYYPVSRYHFDLSGTAFGAMAKYGRHDELRHAGIIDMQFKR